MSQTMPTNYTLQVASDIVRGGLGAELLDHERNVVAEIFRSDKDKTVIVNTFENEIPIKAFNALMEFARDRLDPFEDGTPLMEVWKW